MKMVHLENAQVLTFHAQAIIADQKAISVQNIEYIYTFFVRTSNFHLRLRLIFLFFKTINQLLQGQNLSLNVLINQVLITTILYIVLIFLFAFALVYIIFKSSRRCSANYLFCSCQEAKIKHVARKLKLFEHLLGGLFVHFKDFFQNLSCRTHQNCTRKP